MTHVFHPNRATLLAATAVLSLFVGGGLLPAIAADPATEVATSPSPSSVLVTVEGTVLEIADLPDDANHLFIEAAPGLAVPLDPDSLPEPVASGQSVTATLEVPEWVVAEASEEIAALDDGDLPPQVEASDEVGEVLMEAAAELDAALDVAGLSVTTDSPVYLAADSAPHIVDLVFFSRDGRGKFYSASEIDYLLGSLSAWWARETKGEIPAFVYSYAEARAAQTTAHCTATFAQMSNEAAQLFGHASYSNPYMMPNSRRHLVILSPVDEYGTGCPRLYTGAGYYGYGELAAGGVVHLTTQSVETSVDVLVHEIGHNLSLPHASAGSCPSGVVDGPIGSTGEICVYGGNDYSDSYNVMGLSQSWATTGLSGFQKERLGLLTRQSPEFQVVEALGSYDIALRDTSRASGPGVEALQVVDTLGASKRNYWIEYDSRSGGVHVRRGCRLEDETLPYPGGNVPSTWILSPEGSRPYSSQKFLAGQGFISDGGGMVFRVDQVSEDVARVHVELSATPTPSVSTSLSSWSPEGTYRTTRVVITTNQAWWSASSDESWLTLSTSVGNNGMEITLFAAENLTGLPRSATVSFVAGGAVTRLPVLQAGQPPKITLSITGWFPGAGVTTITTTPSTNQATWSASTDAEWLTVSPPTGARGETAWITAVPNAEKTTRVGRVTFEAGGVRATLPVTQDALRPSVQLFPTSWSTGAGANSTGLFVSTNMPSWVASTDQSWLTVTPANGVTGDMAQVSAEPNTSTLARTGTVRFSADTGSALFTVTQAGATQGLTLSHSLWFPNAAEERLEVGVSTNQSSWSASSNQTWLTTSPSSGSAGQTMTVIVTASELSASRSGVVTVVAGEARATLVVRQEPKYVSVKVSPPLWTPEAGSSSSQVWVTTNQSLSWSASSNQSWLTVSSSTGISGAAMTLAASANTTGSPRSATVSVVAGTARTTVAVTQAEGAVVPPSVSLSASMWSAGAGVASTGVVVSTNQSSWSASSNQSWLSVSPSSGQDGQTMTVSAQANTSPASRSAMVLVSAGGASTTLSVLQAAGAAANVRLPFASWSPGAGQESLGVVVSTNQSSWSASSNQTWLSLSPSSGQNGQTMKVSAQANTSSVSRSAVVTVSAGGASATLSVVQAAPAPSLQLPFASWWAGSEAASTGVVVSTSQSSWSASSNQSWLTVSPSSGQSGQTMTVSAQANMSAASRYATVTVVAGGTSTTLSVTQAAASAQCSSFGTACSWGLSPIVVSPVGTSLHYLRFTAPATGQYVFESSGRETNADPYALLYAADQSQITYNDDGAGNLEFRITATLVAGQVYYLAVRHYSSVRSGQFTVTAKVPAP